MAIERLSREDRFMLWPDRRWPQVNGALLILDGRPLPDGAGRFQIDRARSFIESRLERVPRFRQLLYVPPRRLGGPVWIDARQFDVSEHVAEVPVPDPAGEAELLAVVENLLVPPARSLPPPLVHVVSHGPAGWAGGAAHGDASRHCGRRGSDRDRRGIHGH